MLPLVTRQPKRVVALFVARRETQTHFQRLHRDLSQYYRISLFFSLAYFRLRLCKKLIFCVLEGDFVNKHKRRNGIMQISTRIFDLAAESMDLDWNSYDNFLWLQRGWTQKSHWRRLSRKSISLSMPHRLMIGGEKLISFKTELCNCRRSWVNYRGDVTWRLFWVNCVSWQPWKRRKTTRMEETRNLHNFRSWTDALTKYFRNYLIKCTSILGEFADAID